jgi:hypothetical protein
MCVDEQKPVLIISDEDEAAQKMAAAIGSVFCAPLFAGYKVSTVIAENFSGKDLLPAAVFFLGCVKPGPESFLYIEDLFRHINLAGRPCGLFSPERKALKYLSVLVSDSEAAAGRPLLAKGGRVKNNELEKWIQAILKEVQTCLH